MIHRVFRRRIRLAASLGFLAGVSVLVVQAGVTHSTPGAAASSHPRDDAHAGLFPEPVIRQVGLRQSRAAAGVASARGAVRTPGVWSLPAGEIDPAASSVEDGRLVQHLRDGTLVTLTLDPVLQKLAVRALARYRVEYGSIIVIRPSTGEVLAMAEHAEAKPESMQLALQAEAPAASIFKIVTATALIDHAGLTAHSTICTHGGYRKLELTMLEDSPKWDTRCDTLAQAFGASRNVAFARWADRQLQPETLEETAERFLFNRQIPFLWGVDMSRINLPKGSRLGMARAAAGFTGATLSPMHAALMAAAVANDGTMMAPRVVARAQRGDEILYEAEHKALAHVMAPATAAELRKLFAATVAEGTARKFFQKRRRDRIPGITIGGKTGHLSGRDRSVARHYSWFVGIAPLENADLAISALVVNGEVWTTKGVVVASDVLAGWYERGGRQGR